jgi:hypothetical protein
MSLTDSLECSEPAEGPIVIPPPFAHADLRRAGRHA